MDINLRNGANASALSIQQNAILKAHKIVDNTRKKNTRRAYLPKIKEFEDFCIKQQFPLGTLVTEDTLLAFIQQAVEGRSNKHDSSKSISVKTVKSYVNAIVWLYSTQHSIRD